MPYAQLRAVLTADLVIRAPNHLGDLVLSLPALHAAGEADVVVRAWLAPLLDLAALPGRVVPLGRGSGGFVRCARALRRRGYGRGVLLTPAFSAALLFAAAGVRQRRGTDTDGRGPLLTERVTRAHTNGLHRAASYLMLVTGATPAEPAAPRLPVPGVLRDRFADLVPGAPAGPLIGLFPGSKASARRWSADRFRELGARLAAEGARVAVFGAAGERALTAHVAGGAALDLGGRTDLPLLAAGLAACDLLVTNDSGPLHLAAAVGTPTVSLWGAGDPAVTGPLGPGHKLVRHAELPCVPCVQNRCPRRGSGTVLPDARRECLELVTVAEVEAAVRQQLTVHS
ncbi:MAG: glycosyltransferase family 9 protein [Gemmatimonadetes bacterium]|nr:glycosyltransferase family 9 protein [Gemmatimonadota bacterium]